MITQMAIDNLQDIVRENIRARRLELRVTQQALADAAGVKQPTIAQIEAGTISPTLVTVAKIADALHVSPDLLLRRGIFSETPA